MKNKTYYIGWDVGGWNCDNNSKSKDAIVIFDCNEKIVGEPFRGNLKELINESKNATAFINGLFEKCNKPNLIFEKIILAIDAPLAFSEGLKTLIAGKISVNIGEHQSNPYLFRETEMKLFGCGFKPLSSVKDMIGSQTTKAMHVLAKFNLSIKTCGVWQDKTGLLTVIETYPAACTQLNTINEIDNKLHQDIKDAWICAEIAYLFHKKSGALQQPDKEINEKEGWIWITNKQKQNGN